MKSPVEVVAYSRPTPRDGMHWTMRAVLSDGESLLIALPLAEPVPPECPHTVEQDLRQLVDVAVRLLNRRQI